MKTWVSILLAVIGIAASCRPADVSEQEESSPAWKWRISVPEDEGVDVEVLDELHSLFSSGECGYIDSMLLVRNGAVIYEQTYQNDYGTLNLNRDSASGLPVRYYDSTLFPYFRETGLHTMQSVTKSVTAAVVGVALKRGDLVGIDLPIQDFFPAEAELFEDERKQTVTFRHLLTMTMGNDWDESKFPYTNSLNPAVAMEKSDDWVRFVLERKMIHEPGTRFSYSSGTSQLLSVILQKATGLSVEEYAARFLFEPLGISAYHWAKTPQGLTDTEGGLYLRPRDLAKIGQLHLQDGVWFGKRVLAEGWAGSSTQPMVDTGRQTDRRRPEQGTIAYGFQWWLFPIDLAAGRTHAVMALGFGGQRLMILREYDLIAVFTGWNIYDHPSLAPQVLYDYILECIKR